MPAVYATALASERQPRVWAALASVYLIWGSTFLAIRVGLEGFPPILLAGVRFTLAGGVLFTALWARGYRVPNAREWGGSLFIGALLCGSNALLMVAEQWVSSGLAALALLGSAGGCCFWRNCVELYSYRNISLHSSPRPRWGRSGAGAYDCRTV